MSDALLRARQRAWESNPGDQEALAAYIAALRSAGEVVSLELLKQRRFPPRTVRVLPGWEVSFRDSDSTDEFQEASVPEGGGEIELPAHLTWCVSLDASTTALDQAWEVLAAEEVRHLNLSGEGLAAFSLKEVGRLSDLEELNLFGAYAWTEGQLSPLAKLPNLHSFSSDQKSLSDLGFLPNTLQDLSLQASLSPQDLGTLADRAPNLRTLQLCARQLAGEGYALLRRLRCLESLTLEDPDSLTLAKLADLRGLPLKRLAVRGVLSLPEESLKLICESFPGLEELELRETFEDLSPLSRLPLKSLELAKFGGRDLNQRTVASLPRTLQKLDLTSPLNDLALESLTRLEELREVELRLAPELEGRGLLALNRLPSLRAISLSADALAPGAFESLLEVSQLTELTLSDATDAQVRELGRAPLLSRLNVTPRHRTTLSPEALGCLAQLPLLESLSLTEARIERAFDASHGFEHLVDLSIFSSEISREALADLARVPRLWFLHFLDCGVLEGAEALTSLRELGFLGLAGNSSLSDAAISTLRAGLPEGCTLDLGAQS